LCKILSPTFAEAFPRVKKFVGIKLTTLFSNKNIFAQDKTFATNFRFYKLFQFACKYYGKYGEFLCFLVPWQRWKRKIKFAALLELLLSEFNKRKIMRKHEGNFHGKAYLMEKNNFLFFEY
jgi:hypothetical protein